MKFNVICAKRKPKTNAAVNATDCWKDGLKIDLKFRQIPSAVETLSLHLFDRDHQYLGGDTVCLDGQPATSPNFSLSVGGWNSEATPEMMALVVIDDCPTWYARLTLADHNTAAVSQVLQSVFDSPELHHLSTVLWNNVAGESCEQLHPDDFSKPSKARSGTAKPAGSDIEELRQLRRLILGEEPPRVSAEEKLRQLIGLDRVKQEIEQARVLALFGARRRALGIDTRTDHRNHMLFYGNPGTGKTTVAKLIGEMYRDMGLLSKGHTVEVNRSKLIGEYIGETEQKVETFIQESRGGVLFIDEAYSLSGGRDDSRDFGKQVLNALLPVLSEPEPDMIVILAGYEDKMQQLLQTNQGLLDRFPLKFHFDDYDAEQLFQIAVGILDQHHFSLTTEATARLLGIMQRAVSRRDHYFGNGRWVHNLVEQGIEKCLARRVMAAEEAQLKSGGASAGPQQSVQQESEEALQRERRLFSTVEECDVAEAERQLCTRRTMAPSARRPIGFTA